MATIQHVDDERAAVALADILNGDSEHSDSQKHKGLKSDLARDRKTGEPSLTVAGRGPSQVFPAQIAVQLTTPREWTPGIAY